jgi:polar amino acid transport system substrate-binding protein
MRKLHVFALMLVTLLALTAAACGGDEEADEAAPTTQATVAQPDQCAKDQLDLVTPGQLTIGTDNPAFPPWFQDAEGAPWDPTKEPTKQGYEAAVAYAIAAELGFSDEEVKWTVVPFDNAFKPGPKDFDFDINQVSYTEERDGAVDFSDSYYDVQQAIVTLKSSEYADAAALADFEGAKLGAPVGTTSFEVIQTTIQPGEPPAVFNTNNDAVSALKNGQVDGIVVDLPTAFFITAVQVPKGKIVGQVAAESQEYFGLVFEEGNSLRDCVNEALAALREDGTLDQIEQEWLADKANAPVLE